MRLWAEITDAAGTRLGAGPVWSIEGATVTRMLDGAGSISFTTPGTEKRAIDLLQNERRAILYNRMPTAPASGAAQNRELSRGILRNVKMSGRASGFTLSVDGPDLLDELKRENTLLGRIYQNETVANIASSLAGLAGWTANVDAAIASDTLGVRYDGQSVLKALQNLCDLKGYHLRWGGGKQIDIAPLGAVCGVRLVNATYASPEIYDNDDIMLIQSISIKRSSEQLFNWILPVGGGEGDSALTLEYSTRTSPYTIQTTSVGGRTLYYIADASSAGAYGTIKKVGRFKQISPVSNNDADLQVAANALYDAAAVYMERHKSPQVTYTVSVKKAQKTIRPGDKIRLIYKGFITNEYNEIVDYIDEDGEFWVLKVTERHGVTGMTMSLDISNVDQHERDTAEVLVGALEAIEIRELRVQPYPALGTPAVYRREIDSTHDADVPIDITNNVLYLQQCRVRLFTRPFRATAKAVSSGGGSTQTSAGGGGGAFTSAGGGGVATSSGIGGANHQHVIASYQSTSTPTGDMRRFQVNTSSGVMDVWLNASSAQSILSSGVSADHQHTISLPDHTHGVSIPSHSHSVTIPAHTHDLDYGINDDSAYPDTVRLAVNGVDVTAALGGPWGVGGGEINEVVDITTYLVNAAGGLRQRHTVTISCDDGQGEVEVTVELRLTVQSISADV